MKQEFLSLFPTIRDLPRDPVFGLQEEFGKDARGDKINLTIGITLEEDGSPPKILHSVHLAEMRLLEEEKSKVYLGIEGDLAYTKETGSLVFGNSFKETIYGGQSVGGTGALRILAEFLKGEISTHISLPGPTWPNHHQIFSRLGFAIDVYPYCDPSFDYEKMRRHLEKLPPKTVVLLHPSCHNPTGVDLSLDQWQDLSNLFHKRGLIPFFDSAYQGFGQGLEGDRQAIELFTEAGHEFFLAHSYSKSMSLYAERVGAYFIVMQSEKTKDLVRRNVSSLIRTNYSNPPKHGAAVARKILQEGDLSLLWRKELEEIRKRMVKIRKDLAKGLSEKSGRDFSFIEKGSGFFTLLGLNAQQIEQLKKERALYIGGGSRINLSAINGSNFDRIIEEIVTVL